MTSTAKIGTIQQPHIVSPTPSLQPQEDMRYRRLELVNTLQSTLELNEQLTIFKRWINQSVAIDGLKYSNSQHNINFSLGHCDGHQCNYRLNTNNESLGEIEFSRKKPFKEEELSQIETDLTALLYPIRNALQYYVAVQTALRDPLTGTGNRIALDNALHRECQLAERYSQSVSILMLDIDHFKQINDQYGHTAGDEVLKQIADTVRNVTRATDMTFRYGGEEFVVVLSKTDIAGAEIIADRIRQHISAKPFETQAGAIPVTASIGASKLNKSERIKDLFNRADQALYLAKNSGRNQVVCQ